MSVTLEAVDGVLPAAEPGAHIDVEISPGCVRQYSLCQAIDEVNVYRLGILRDPASRGGSRAAFDHMQVGKEFSVGPPRNNFALKQCAGATLLFAGGIGITPLLSMAEQLSAQKRPFSLYYTTRSRDKAAFLLRLSSSDMAQSVGVFHDDAVGAPRFDPAEIPALRARRRFISVAHPNSSMLCGPRQFCGDGRMPGIQIERFQNDVDVSGIGFTVVARRSGLSVEVGENETIAEKLLDAGVDVPLLCEEGICGACLTPVLEGEADHRDAFRPTRQVHSESCSSTL